MMYRSRSLRSIFLPVLLLALLFAARASAQHAEADGLVLRMGGEDIVTVWQGVAGGEIEVHHEEFTDPIEVFFLGPDSTLFQPDEPEFSLGAVIGDPAIAGHEELSQWSFRLEGLLEGMTDLTLSLIHEGHADFTSPPIEVHVEEQHAEADGLVLRMGGEDIVTVWQGVAGGEIEVHHEEFTDPIEVFFLGPDSTLFQPDEPEFSLGAVIGDPAIAGHEELSQWSFRLEGLLEGMTDLTLSLIHEGHADFTSPPLPVSVQAATDVPGIASSGFDVLPNHPNPFNPSTEIRFRLPGELAVTMRVFDLAGRQVRTLLASETRQAGEHSVTWRGVDDDGRAVGTGVYFYHVEAGSHHAVRKMTLLK